MCAARLITLNTGLTRVTIGNATATISTGVQTVGSRGGTRGVHGACSRVIGRLLDRQRRTIEVTRTCGSRLRGIIVDSRSVRRLRGAITGVLGVVASVRVTNTRETKRTTIRTIGRRAGMCRRFVRLVDISALGAVRLVNFGCGATVKRPLALVLGGFLLSGMGRPSSMDVFRGILAPRLIRVLGSSATCRGFEKVLKKRSGSWIGTLSIRYISTTNFLMYGVEGPTKYSISPVVQLFEGMPTTMKVFL